MRGGGGPAGVRARARAPPRLSGRALKIVSGGQTGVDRGALDAALAAGAPCGGWCPRGRRAEDGPIPARYPLVETDSPDYTVRTRANVADSDATLIIAFGTPSGGTALTIDYCQELDRPWLLIDAEQEAPAEAAVRARTLIEGHAVAVLNVAGPRASGEARGTDYARRLVAALLAPA